jgi:hypothetical protein
MSDPENARETTLQDFLKGFRIALNFISLYSKEHKSFIAAVGDLKGQLDLILAASSPLTICFTPDSLSVDGTVYAKKQLYLDLGRQFHFRKVKSLQLNRGITLQELSAVLETICLPVKEVMERGGVTRMLAAAGAANVVVEELDYSSLLGQRGGVEADVGAYLLNQSMVTQDPAKIEEFALHFESAIAHISIKSIAEDKQLSDNLHNFLAYIHKTDDEGFNRCVESLFRIVLKDRAPATREQMAAFVGFVQDLSSETVADIIVDEALANDDFNSENLTLFMRESGAHGADAVNESLARTISEGESAPRLSAKASKKLKALFTVSEAPLVQGIYQRVMETLSRNIPAEAPVVFDRGQTLHNYRSILVFVLGDEQNSQRLEDVAQKICLDWQAIIKEQEPDYFKALSAALSLQRGQVGTVTALKQLDHLFRRYVEDSIWEHPVPEWMSGLMDDLQESTRESSWYIERMFGGAALNRHILALFLRLFPEDVPRFCEHLARAANDIEFIGNVIEELKHVPASQASIVMEQIFGFSNDLIKIEVLKAMQAFPDRDAGFLLPILSEDNFMLRKEAMGALASGGQPPDKALDLLLRDDDVWGRKNARIEENIGIVEELAVRGALPFLERLTRKPFFWNAAVRTRARKALEALG